MRVCLCRVDGRRGVWAAVSKGAAEEASQGAGGVRWRRALWPGKGRGCGSQSRKLQDAFELGSHVVRITLQEKTSLAGGERPGGSKWGTTANNFGVHKMDASGRVAMEAGEADGSDIYFGGRTGSCWNSVW